MSDVQTPVPAAAPAAPAIDKRAQAEQVLQEILKWMEMPARLELKDAADGAISVAMFFEKEVPGVAPGKRSHVIDALQFIVNKIVNRPQTERRWINLGVGGHPEPRPAPAEKSAKPAAPAVNGNGQAPSAPRPPKAEAQRPTPSKASVAAAQVDELKLEVTPDEDLAKAGRQLAEKSAQFGRYFAVSPMKVEDRARLAQAAQGVKGMSVKLEGEGRNRRVVFVPDKPAPMPKRAMPDYDDDEE